MIYAVNAVALPQHFNMQPVNLDKADRSSRIRKGIGSASDPGPGNRINGESSRPSLQKPALLRL